MKVAIIGANGKCGRAVLNECLNKGYAVVAVVRNAKSIQDDRVTMLNREIAALHKEDLADCEVIVNCFGTWTSETLPLHTVYAEKLCDLIKGTDKRLIVVGGAGSLYLNPEHTLQLYQSESFPREYVETATAQAEELAYLRGRQDVRWTFFSPAAIFDPSGRATGEYVLGGEEFMLNADQESYISYADYARALVDEIGAGRFIQKRFTAVSSR